MSEITKEMTIGKMLQVKPEAGKALLEIGMHCLGCPSAQGETLEQAAQVHGVQIEDLMKRIEEA